jgi:hypothetical protein
VSGVLKRTFSFLYFRDKLFSPSAQKFLTITKFSQKYGNNEIFHQTGVFPDLRSPGKEFFCSVLIHFSIFDQPCKDGPGQSTGSRGQVMKD